MKATHCSLSFQLNSYSPGVSYLQQVLSWLQHMAPFWKVAVWPMNTRHHGLPQSRPRLYVVGVNAALGIAMPSPPHPSSKEQGPVNICQLLHPNIPRIMDLRARPGADHLADNLLEYEARSHQYQGRTCIFEVDIQPDKRQFTHFCVLHNITFSLIAAYVLHLRPSQHGPNKANCGWCQDHNAETLSSYVYGGSHVKPVLQEMSRGCSFTTCLLGFPCTRTLCKRAMLLLASTSKSCEINVG